MGGPPYLADLPLRDQLKMMERPFFSLAQVEAGKADRLPLVRRQAVSPCLGQPRLRHGDNLGCGHPDLLRVDARRGINDVPRKLHLMPYDLLRAIGRQPTARAYDLLG